MSGLVGVPYAISSLTGVVIRKIISNERWNLLLALYRKQRRHSAEKGPPQLPLADAPRRRRLTASPAFAPADGGATWYETDSPAPEEISRGASLRFDLGFAIAVLGISLGWLYFRAQPLRQMPRLLENKYYVDEIYDATIINPIHVGSREGLWKLFDVGVIDGLIHDLGRAVIDFGKTIRYMQIGFVRAYAAIILAGALIIIGYFAYNGAHVLRFLVR